MGRGRSRPSAVDRSPECCSRCFWTACIGCGRFSAVSPRGGTAYAKCSFRIGRWTCGTRINCDVRLYLCIAVPGLDLCARRQDQERTRTGSCGGPHDNPKHSCFCGRTNIERRVDVRSEGISLTAEKGGILKLARGQGGSPHGLLGAAPLSPRQFQNSPNHSLWT